MPFAASKTTSAQEWSRWKQTLEFYFIAEGITDAKVKQAKLLLGGPEIQDIFYSLPLAEKLPKGKDLYTLTIELLDAPITPRTTNWHERHILSTVKQEKGGSISNFIMRLRKQANCCGFADSYAEEAVQEGQLVNGCSSPEVRKELMKKAEKVSLANLEKVVR